MTDNDQASGSPTADQLVKTCRSGDVILNLFLRHGEFGPYLEPSRPVYRYQADEGEVRFSEWLRDRHCLHASFCYQMAHAFIQAWKSRSVDEAQDDEPAPPKAVGNDAA